MEYTDNFGIITGVKFPFHVEHYGYISNPDDWQNFVNRVEALLAPECDCVTDEQSCPACRAKAREVYAPDGVLEF